MKATKEKICKEGTTTYYLRRKSMGCFLEPVGHPSYFYSIQEGRGRNAGASSIPFAASCEWMPTEVRKVAQSLLDAYTPPTGQEREAWAKALYAYFRNCYSPDGINRSTTDCIVAAGPGPIPMPEHHLAYLAEKAWYPDTTPRLDWITIPPEYGKGVFKNYEKYNISYLPTA